MLDVAPTELLVVALIALLVIGPKDLPKAMRFVGQWVGKARRMAGQFRVGIDAMMRESELAEMEKKWAEENARIMREHPHIPAPADIREGGDGEPAPEVARPVIHDEPSLPFDEPRAASEPEPLPPPPPPVPGDRA